MRQVYVFAHSALLGLLPRAPALEMARDRDGGDPQACLGAGWRARMGASPDADRARSSMRSATSTTMPSSCMRSPGWPRRPATTSMAPGSTRPSPSIDEADGGAGRRLGGKRRARTAAAAEPAHASPRGVPRPSRDVGRSPPSRPRGGDRQPVPDALLRRGARRRCASSSDPNGRCADAYGSERLDPGPHDGMGLAAPPLPAIVAPGCGALCGCLFAAGERIGTDARRLPPRRGRRRPASRSATVAASGRRPST